MSDAYATTRLDHLGLVAAMCDELGLVERIDARIAQDLEQRHVSVGLATKAMILNGLGFVNQRLYLVPRFFETKPTERLLGEGILPEHLNDDTLGRALDALYEAGVTELFRDLAAHAAQVLGLSGHVAHLDATSFHVDGRYNSAAEAVEEGVVHIRQGYSRDHRPELNQVVLDLMVEHQAGLPILMQPLSGNASDQASFPELIRAHLAALRQAHGLDYIVADAALFSAEHLRELDQSGMRFITRVPETLSEAKEVLAAARRGAMTELADGYQGVVHRSDYGDVEQRWLVVHSDAAEARAARSVPRRLAKQHEREQKAWRRLARRSYACRADAAAALKVFADELLASRLEGAHVLECRHVRFEDVATEAASFSYRLTGDLVLSSEHEAALVWRGGLFIVTTNELDEEVLSNEALLAGYKGQHQVERGFRFLKDPVFLASALFLRTPRRVMALLMVMTLCLLVYAALEWRIRRGLGETEEVIADQKGKPTSRPTTRWVFYVFEGIDVLAVGDQRLVLNLSAAHETVLSVLGSRYRMYYQSQAP